MHFGRISEISVTWYECCNVIRSEDFASPPDDIALREHDYIYFDEY